MAVSDCSSIHSRLGFPNALTSVTFFCRSFCYLRRANFKVDFAFATCQTPQNIPDPSSMPKQTRPRLLAMKFRFFDEWIRHFEDTKWAK